MEATGNVLTFLFWMLVFYWLVGITVDTDKRYFRKEHYSFRHTHRRK